MANIFPFQPYRYTAKAGALQDLAVSYTHLDVYKRQGFLAGFGLGVAIGSVPAAGVGVPTAIVEFTTAGFTAACGTGSGSSISTGVLAFAAAIARAGASSPETKRPAIRNRTAITGTTTQGTGGSLRGARAAGFGTSTGAGRGAGAVAGCPPVIGKPPSASRAQSNGNWR